MVTTRRVNLKGLEPSIHCHNQPLPNNTKMVARFLTLEQLTQLITIIVEGGEGSLEMCDSKPSSLEG